MFYLPMVSHVSLAKKNLINLIAAFVTAFLLSWTITQPSMASSGGLALSGYDPVSYFVAGKPEKGDKKFTALFEGHRYTFTSQENADLFLSDPKKYAPQFGANCAFGMAYGNKSSVNPKIWKIVDGKLYLHINSGTQKIWTKKQQSYIKRADAAWAAIKQ